MALLLYNKCRIPPACICDYVSSNAMQVTVTVHNTLMVIFSI